MPHPHQRDRDRPVRLHINNVGGDTAYHIEPGGHTILGLSPRTISGRFTGFFLGDVIDELPRFYIEPCSDVQERQNAGTTLSVLDIDEAAEAQPAAFCEIFQAVFPLLSEATDLHTQRQESWVR